MRQDTARLSRDFLTDTSVSKKKVKIIHKDRKGIYGSQSGCDPYIPFLDLCVLFNCYSSFLRLKEEEDVVELVVV